MPNFDPSCFRDVKTGIMIHPHTPYIEPGAEDDGQVRTFATGATRDTSEDKYDPEGFISPLVIERYCEYMHMNRVQSDGSLRDSDNWMKGMGLSVFMKSMWRHFFDVWKIHRGYRAERKEKGKWVLAGLENALCGLLFNVMGYLHEHLKARGYMGSNTPDDDLVIGPSTETDSLKYDGGDNR